MLGKRTPMQQFRKINKKALFRLVHSPYELVDEDFPVAVVTTLNEVPCLLPEATTSRAELERPQEIVGLLEVWAHREDLVD